MANGTTDGLLWKFGTIQGDAASLKFTRTTQAMADADQTPTSAVFECPVIECTGALTAGRNLVLPLVDGAVYLVSNQTTGGFAVTVKGSSGAGIAIAAGKDALVRCNGTRYYRVTADTDPTA